MSLIDRDRAHVWHPYTQMQTAPPPLPIVRGEGVYLFTEDGRKILDGISSWWVNIHGHSHPALNAALARQASRLEHVMFAGCTHPPAVDLAERLVSILPRGLTRVFYSDNGSTAVEVAVKMAIQYWINKGQAQRTRIVALHHGYHGDTVGAMSVSGDSIFTRAFSSLLFPVTRAHGAEVEQTLASLGDTAAALIVEPMLQGAGGMIIRPAELLEAIRRACDRYGVLLVADEVLTGFGRTGRMFACEHAIVSPDIICLSKALTAGYLPLGATCTTDAVYEAFLSHDRARTFFHGHSFTANPLACAVALASLDLFESDRTLDRVTRLEAQLQSGLAPLRALPIVADVRVIGGVGVVELAGSGADPSAPRDGYLDEIGPRLAAAFLDRGLLLRPLGNVVYFMPPYVITEEETAWAIDQIAQVLMESAAIRR
ncbi:MAG: adenosylmethionine--8-amino-7-oxononanoate transaminase [Acidobacteria bacterium]|nr:MAG: adenosylmethionine--8-amino-7-oxononanoate transaminase [Acidobacteriota bacterium]